MFVWLFLYKQLTAEWQNDRALYCDRQDRSRLRDPAHDVILAYQVIIKMADARKNYGSFKWYISTKIDMSNL